MKKVGVTCRGLHLAYGATEVLKDVSLDIAPGEFFALLGPSGSGKSTLLRAIAGFARHDRGELRIDGQDVSALAPWQRNVGMVFQSYALWPHLTVWDNVAFGLVERRLPKAVIAEKVAAALDLVGLAEFGQRRPNQLSGGQQQRVALARTIVIEPQVLLLDEPLSNLDKTLRVQMRQELLAMQRRLGLTTIFVTHDQEEAMTTADRMAVLDGGVVQQVGTPAALYDEPANPFVAGFVGTMNLLAARLLAREASHWRVAVDGIGELQVPAAAAAPGAAEAQALLLSCRPQALAIVAVGDGAVSANAQEAQAVFDATVESSEFVGGFTRHHLRAGPHLLAVDRVHRSGALPVAAGASVRVCLDLSQLRLFAAASG